ncbi:hypothetical protein ACH5RR_023052 [Cinchona calisaya]|uniref:MADS-box domain-containing protein n=1 Tax=Cinchona calisaya TaxID=153742 RepID=A0ABD2ZCZ9_9GENT
MEVKVLNRQHKQQQKKVAIMRAKSFCCKKRRDCIKRKTRELSVLCDIKACLVVLGPNGEVETWPENADDVREVIHMYQQFSAKNCCKNKRVFEPTVKVENPDDHVEEIVKENLEFGTAEVDSKFEILDEKTGLLNEEKGKEIVVFDCDENELNRKYLSELWELLEEEETSEDSRGVQLSNLELLSEQSCIPCFEPITEQNIIRYPQFCTNSLNNSGMNLILESISTVHENAPNIPQEFNSFNNPINHGLNFFPSESKKNIQFSDDQSFCFDSTNYESRIFDANLMPSEFYPQFQDGANFCGGTLLQPTMIADAVNAGQTIFGDSPQLLCPLPQEEELRNASTQTVRDLEVARAKLEFSKSEAERLKTKFEVLRIENHDLRDKLSLESENTFLVSSSSVDDLKTFYQAGNKLGFKDAVEFLNERL